MLSDALIQSSIALLLISVLQMNRLQTLYMLNFQHIDANSKLSHNSIHCVTKKFYGFIWIGAEDRLNIYDGYNTQIYKQTGFSKYQSEDGMDLVLCRIIESTDSNAFDVVFAGAKKPLYQYCIPS